MKCESELWHSNGTGEGAEHSFGSSLTRLRNLMGDGVQEEVTFAGTLKFPLKSATYKRVTLQNGSTHWFVSMIEERGSPLTSFVCASVTTSSAYLLTCRTECIASIEEFPPEMLEVMPPDEAPFGFAAFQRSMQKPDSINHP